MLQHQVAVDIKGLSGTYKKIKDRAVRKKQDIRGEAVLVFPFETAQLSTPLRIYRNQ